MKPNFDFQKIESPENEIEDFQIESICEKAEKIITEKNKLGYGYSADVYLEAFQSGNLAYKIIHNIVKPYQNSAENEADYMMRVKNLGDEVVVPTPFACLSYKNESNKFYKNKPNLEVLVMKAMDGLTIEEAVSDPDFLNRVDIDKFCNTLKAFVEKMNNENIYHRDIHNKNVMIDKKTLKPILIDFGLSTLSFGDDNPYIEVVYSDLGKGYKEKMGDRLRNDLSQVEVVRADLKNGLRGLQNK